MIKIDPTAFKETKFFLGTITMALPNTERTEWSFILLRTSNGKVEVEVEANQKEFEAEFLTSYDSPEDREKETKQMNQAMSMLEETVLANIAKDQINYQTQNK